MASRSACYYAGEMAESDLITALTEHGFSLNESRAYAALHRAGPCTGYEVGQKAQIPRSAVYGALRRLVTAGAARSIAGQPERFVAAPPDALLSLLRDRFDVSAVKLDEAVRSLDHEPTVPDAFSVRGYDRVLEEARRLIQAATKRIVISGWPRELEAIGAAVRDAAGRKIKLWIFSHAAIPESVVGAHFSYGLEEAALEDFWKHRLVIVADDAHTLIGASEQADTDVAVISETPAIAELATSQIGLDLTLLAQRAEIDTTELMAELLGDRVGRLDTLLRGPERLVFDRRSPKKAARRNKRRRDA